MRLLQFIALTWAGVYFAVTPALAQWQPARNIELIAPAAAGSALDNVARLLQRVAQNKQLVKASITVVNSNPSGTGPVWPKPRWS